MTVTVEWRGMLRAALVLCAGCAAPQPRIRSALQTPPGAPSPEIAAAYPISCPDVVDVSFASRPALSGRYSVDPDGAIAVAGVGRVPISGLVPAAAAGQLASSAGTPNGQVRVAVAEYNSRLIMLFGPVSGNERALPYQGPETVVELLRRTGGLTMQARPDEVHVVRPHVAAGKRPEVFPVDLEAILLRNDDRTNVVIEPYDQVYVGTTRRSVVAKYLPLVSHESPTGKAR